MDQKYYWVTSLESWALSSALSALSDLMRYWAFVFELFSKSVTCRMPMVLPMSLLFRNEDCVHQTHSRILTYGYWPIFHLLGNFTSVVLSVYVCVEFSLESLLTQFNMLLVLTLINALNNNTLWLYSLKCYFLAVFFITSL